MKNHRLLLALSFIAFLAAGCASAPKRPVINATHPWLTEGPKPTVALVLSGGASRGIAHIGVIRLLEQEKIPVDFIVGTSAGSLIGALYGVSKNSLELEWMAYDLKKEDIFDFTILRPTQGYVKGEKLAQFVLEKVGLVNLQDLRIPLYVTATDLETGELVVFSSVPVDQAVLASASIPVLFPPVKIGNRLFVDGGVVNNVPADVARQKGADIVIAVDVSESVINRNLNNIKDYALQAITIMMAENSKVKYQYADVVIRPDVSGIGILDFSRKRELLSMGLESAQNSLPEIRKAFVRWYEKQVESEE